MPKMWQERPHCRTRKREEPNESNGYDNFPDSKKTQKLNPSELKYDFVRMLSHKNRN